MKIYKKDDNLPVYSVKQTKLHVNYRQNLKRIRMGLQENEASPPNTSCGGKPVIDVQNIPGPVY